MVTPGVLLIGYGNGLCGDDDLGRWLAETVQAWNAPGLAVLSVPQLYPELAEDLRAVDRAVFVDASRRATLVRPRWRFLYPEETTSGRSGPRGPIFSHHLSARALLSLCQAVYGHFPRSWQIELPADDFSFTHRRHARFPYDVELAAQQFRAALERWQRRHTCSNP